MEAALGGGVGVDGVALGELVAGEFEGGVGDASFPGAGEVVGVDPSPVVTGSGGVREGAPVGEVEHVGEAVFGVVGVGSCSGGEGVEQVEVGGDGRAGLDAVAVGGDGIGAESAAQGVEDVTDAVLSGLAVLGDGFEELDTGHVLVDGEVGERREMLSGEFHGLRGV